MLGTMRLVVRNHLGHFVAAKALVFEFVSSPLYIEALTVREGLLLATQRGYHDIIIKSDAL